MLRSIVIFPGTLVELNEATNIGDGQYEIVSEIYVGEVDYEYLLTIGDKFKHMIRLNGYDGLIHFSIVHLEKCEFYIKATVQGVPIRKIES